MLIENFFFWSEIQATMVLSLTGMCWYYMHIVYLMGYQPLRFSTKYLAGHTDLLGGAVSYGDPKLGSQIDQMQKLFGNNMVHS